MDALNDVTLYVGATNFSIAGDGRWYQEAFDHNIKRVSPSLGFEFTSGGKNWAYSLGYLYVGKVSSSAEAVADDTNYDKKTKSCRTPCLPVSHWYGQGNVQQISLSTRKYYGQVFAEFGLALSRPSWSIDVPDWRPNIAYPAASIRKEHNPRIKLLPTFATGYKINDNVIIKLSLVPTSAHGDDWPAIYQGLSTNISVGYKF